MQGNQAEINQQVAIALERLNGRMENLETWRVERDDERRRQEDRRDERDDKQPDQQRATWALAVSAATALIYILTFVSQHWH